MVWRRRWRGMLRGAQRIKVVDQLAPAWRPEVNSVFLSSRVWREVVLVSFVVMVVDVGLGLVVVVGGASSGDVPGLSSRSERVRS